MRRTWGGEAPRVARIARAGAVILPRVTLDPALLFRAACAIALVGVPLVALRTRGRPYAIYSAVTLGLAMPGAIATQALLAASLPARWQGGLDSCFLWGALATLAHFAHLSRARLRSRAFRVLVSIPAQAFVAASFLAGLFQVALLPVRGVLWLLHASGALTALRWLDALPYAVGIASILTSARPRREWVRMRIAKDGPAQLRRAPVERRRRPGTGRGAGPDGERILRIVQITDPHLGPWQSVRRMQRRLEL